MYVCVYACIVFYTREGVEIGGQIYSADDSRRTAAATPSASENRQSKLRSKLHAGQVAREHLQGGRAVRR